MSGRSPPGRRPIPGRRRTGVIVMNESTPMLTHGSSNTSRIAAAMLDFPERGAPFNTTIFPRSVMPPLVSLAHVAGRTRRLGHGGLETHRHRVHGRGAAPSARRGGVRIGLVGA